MQLVSIVTPSFNQAKFIEETLQSVAVQDYSAIEQIVIDGASTDGTPALLRDWNAKIARPGYIFQWVSEPDRGHADALNKGFARASGEFVGWLNSDDVYFDRDVINRAVRAFNSRPDVDVVFGDVALISEDSGLRMIWCFPNFEYRRALRGYIIPQPTVFFRRRVVEKHLLDPELKVALDYVYWLQIGREHKFFHVGAVQAGDRDHSKRQTHVNRELWQEVQQRYRRIFGGDSAHRPVAYVSDFVLRVLLRCKGAIHLLRFFFRDPKMLAFPLWLDGAGRVAKRQFTMRIGPGPELKRPSRLQKDSHAQV